METLPADYLPTLAKACGDRFRCTVAKQGDEIVGFITSLKDGETAIGYFIGFDYAIKNCAAVFSSVANLD